MTSGAQQAIALVATAMVRPGDVVLGEEHTWPGLIDVIQQIGARFEGVRLDQDGLIIDEHDSGGYGIIAGSLCKVVWPGLRLGWLRADAQVVNRLRSHKAVADMFTPALSQILGLAVLERYDELVDVRLEQLRPGADLVLDTLRSDLDDWTIAPLRGGLSVWARMPEHPGSVHRSPRRPRSRNAAPRRGVAHI